MVSLLSSAFVSLLAVSILNVSIPSFTKALGMTPSQVQWVMSGYTLMFGLVLVPAGRLGDAYGRRKLFIIGTSLFLVAVTGGGLATTGKMLIAMRLLEGVAAAIISPQVMGLIQQLFQGAERAKAFGLFGMIVGVATAIGPTLGGILIGILGYNLGWRAAFLINVPICLVAILMARRFLPKDTQNSTNKLYLDLPGILTLGISVLCIMTPFMSGATSFALLRQAPWYLVAMALVGFVVFFWYERFSERRGKEVILPRSLIRDRSYVMGTILLSCYFAGWSGLFIVYTMYLQQGLGFPAWAAGLFQLPLAAGSGIFAPLSSKFVLKRGRWLLAEASFLVALGLIGAVLTVTLAPVKVIPWILLVVLFIAGAGSGLFVSPAQSLSLVTVPVSTGATAAGASQTVQRVGAAMGIACSSLMFYTFLGDASQVQSGSAEALRIFTSGFLAGFVTVILLVVITFVIALIDALTRKDNPLLN